MYSLYLNTTGSNNTANGYQAGRYIADGSTANETSTTSVYLGADTKANADGDTNEIIIGHNSTGLGSNTAVLGNDSTTKTILKGNIGIGTTSPATSAKLDITSTTGALLLSRMTTVQRDALTAVNGMLIYNSTDNKFQGYENGAWANLI